MAINRTFTSGPDSYVADLDDTYTLHFLAGDDTLTVRAGVTTPYMGSGNDLATVEAGSATVHGGGGNDIYRLHGGSLSVVEQEGEGTDTVYSRLSHTLAANVENLVLTGSAATNGGGNSLSNRMIGNGAANTLNGGLGDDRISGGAGNDSLHGGSGNDRLDGGTGNDVLSGGDGIDTASYAGAAAAVTANLALTSAQDTRGAGIDTLTSIERLTGSNFSDRLTGNSVDNAIGGGAGNDNLSGAGGNDRLSGDDGSDVLSGGAGNDSVNGGAGFDTASYASAEGGVSVDLTVSGSQNTGGAGTDTLISIERLVGSRFQDTLTGDAGANSLSGGAGDDFISGGAGAASDWIYGGTGADTMAGGEGADIFAYTSTADAPYDPTYSTGDWIQQFDSSDRIDVSAIDANSGLAGHQDFRFTGYEATTEAGTLHLEGDPAGWGFLYLIGHVDGDGQPDLVILMTNFGGETLYPTFTEDNLII